MLLAFLVAITGCDCTKNPPPPPADTQKPVASISVTSVTTTGASFSFSATDNVGVTNLTLSVVGTTDVTNQSSATVTGLTPNTQYTATLTAKDAAENVGTGSASFTTSALPPQNSTWFAQPTVTITPINGMIGNTVSNEFQIQLGNNAATSKTATFSLSFGANGSAVKMIRIKGTPAPAWTVGIVTGGLVTFSNVTLHPGTTNLQAVFALKEAVGVANGSALSISFSSLNDGEGMTMPIGGSWQAPVAAGTVDANTQATKLSTEWLGYMSQSPLVILPNGTATAVNYNVTSVKVSGPGNARIISVKLRNPYASSLIWNNSSWRTNFGGPDYVVSVNWNGDYVKLSMPNEAIISNTSFTSFITFANIQNASTTNSFNSGSVTPGLFGLELKSKYDLEIVNSAGQVIDLSDAMIKQGANIVAN